MKSLLLMLAVVASANACRFPSNLWCSSEDIARECKVYEQCKKSEWTVEKNAPPVSLALYYESLCPFCKRLIIRQLFPTFFKIGHIMNVTLVPYGNAHEKKVGNEWKFTCQHGEEECVVNMLETCAIHTLEGDMKKITPFVVCMEMEEHPMRGVKRCAEQQKLDPRPILNCFNSSLGNRLEHEMAVMTESLKPKHLYTPWILLNGKHSAEADKEAQINMLKLICDAYTGPKPDECKKLAEEKTVCLKESS